jgi:hypothetical protein
MLGRKRKEFFALYAVLPAGKFKSNQVTFFDPSQDGYFTHAAMAGNGTGGEIEGIKLLNA